MISLYTSCKAQVKWLSLLNFSFILVLICFPNITALLLRIAFVLFGIPRFDILAYLYGMLVSGLLLVFFQTPNAVRRK